MNFIGKPINTAGARARTFSELFPVLRISIAFNAFKYYVRREPGLFAWYLMID
jgi:hypothetical protein